MGQLRAGCGAKASVDVFRRLWCYTVGEVLVRAGSAGRPGPGSFAWPAGELPNLAMIGDDWSRIAARDIYPDDLRVFVRSPLP
ncbi:hypothetical protein [Dactylosporangium matsuzakiense]|uniref:Uncharacterized protein n=1 Tax=Dactylosporangium matsuzakiense TaxID=53360 RepID=A0A9W6KWA1_9ACTN|nr:hypothetical protein [Dactylosporangium matsuzakiense]UWZ49161.1 hypothetical protein Dmats_23860 [Dactylosporangium matsuzakiense]GLL08392.1 hypothetical protein GCM10017581_101530 [Dactylosporangium matsuzakiense]